MITAKKDFIELRFTGIAQGEVFDSNDPEDLKKTGSKDAPKKMIIVIGEKMVIPGLDKALEGKTVGQHYDLHIPYKEGFGPRKPELVKTIPLHVFTHQKVSPQPGMTLFLDNMVANVRAVSGARVITDFNNPLAGKDLEYKFTIVRKIEDLKEKAEALCHWFLQEQTDIEIKDKITIRCEKLHPLLASMLEKKFKELLEKDIEWHFKDPTQTTASDQANSTEKSKVAQ